MSTRTKSTNAKPVTKGQAFSHLDNAKATIASAESTSTIDDARWQRFANLVDANRAFGTILRDEFATVLMGNAKATGYAIRKAFDDESSPVYCEDRTKVRTYGSDAHFTRCLQLVDHDTAARRKAFREQGNGANLKSYIGWIQVVMGTASDETLALFTIERDAAGKVKSAKVKPASARSMTAAKRAELESIVAKGLSYLQAIAPEMWADVAKVLNAKLALDAEDTVADENATPAPTFSIQANA